MVVDAGVTDAALSFCFFGATLEVDAGFKVGATLMGDAGFKWGATLAIFARDARLVCNGAVSILARQWALIA
jgi:hypothetical protein